MALIAFLSLIPMDSGATHFRLLVAVQPDVQNLMHIPAYALLTILWMQALTQQGRLGFGRNASAFVFVAGFGLANELAQGWIPGRYLSLTDGLVNLLGALIGLVFYLEVEKHAPEKIRRWVCS